MRVVLTRPHADSERTAAALEALGHEVLVAPLMRVEPVAADLAGTWSAIVITSANALQAIPAMADKTLPLFAVGDRSAEAARRAGFSEVSSANGDIKDLVRLIVSRFAGAKAPLLYLAGEDRSGDLLALLATHGIAAEMKVVYRTVTEAFPPVLAAALESGDVDAVLHFSRRSADLFVAGARSAGVADPALDVQHLCLSAQVAEPLAGAGRIIVAVRPEEAALLALLRA
ncbi:MAG TPA: uroporphyrinogen-III synthase [Xanthobacteraceae bacterium]|nr:uroporphyrinogen-III synthase [Xanthobacteraceae bacterium]